MSNLKKLLLATALIAITIYLALTALITEVEINKYDSLSTVKEQQAIQKGWIPAILPESASEIVESHDLNTYRIFGSFKYKEIDEARFMEQLKDLNTPDKTFTWGEFLFKVDKKLNLVNFTKKH